MATSLNATFDGVAPVDTEWPHPEGAGLVRIVQQGVRQSGWSVGEFDNWRDVGWNLVSSRGATRLEVIVTSAGPRSWMLQVSPASAPGFLRRALGARPSAGPAEVLELSTLVHRILSGAGPYNHFRWQWDGPPTEQSALQPEQGA